ncbi:MAG: ATP-dependent DNA helicase RecG, partial [Gammaproteobacteria bacterium]
MTSPRIEVPDLERPVDQLRGVGPKLQVLLKKAGIYQIKDLLFRLPLRYLDRTRITPIGSLQPNQYVLIQGEILASDVLFGRRRSLMV